MKCTIVVGNPKPASRTSAAASLLAQGLLGRPADEAIELCDLGQALLAWNDEAVARAVQAVGSSELVIFASPTFKGSYTGLLKLFLDQFAGESGLKDVLAVPLMLGGKPGHAMAPDLLLKPVLVELGATCALPGLFLLDSTFVDGPELPRYVARWAHTANGLLGSR